MSATLLVFIAVFAALAAAAVFVWLHFQSQKTRDLRRSEERYRQLFDQAIEGVYEVSPEGQFLRANRAMARILGFGNAAELLARKPAEVASSYVAAGRRDEILALLNARDELDNFDSEIRRPDGTTAWIRENVRAVRDEVGRLVALQGFAADVTERKRAAGALAASEQRYRALFEHLPVAVIEYDYRDAAEWLERLRGSGVVDLEEWFKHNPGELRTAFARVGVVGANAATHRLLGARTLEDVVAKVEGVYTPEIHEARRRTFLALWEGGLQAEGEFAVPTLDGRTLRVFYQWRVPVIDGRPLVERTQIALIDLTGVKTAEKALAAEREQLSVTLRAMSEAVLTVDQAGAVQFMNDAAEALTGWSVGAAIGRPLREVCLLGSEKPTQRLAAPVAAALGADRVVDLPPYSLIQPREGPPKSVEGRCAPMHDASGRAVGVVLVLRDITQRSRLESELLRASKMESIGVLAGGIAHDFNNLLSVVIGNLSLALMDEQTNPAGAKWLKEAERSALRAKDLTQQLLTFAKGGEPVRTAVALPDVVREAAQFALHGATVSCEFDLAPDLRPADVDKGQIGQVVQNLVINAVQSMPTGGKIQLSLHNETIDRGAVATLPPGNYLRLEVADSGKGIAPEHLARIFEPFFTTKEAGSGLGLATVYSVVQKHHGHVTVESIIGGGTTFRVWLPAARIDPVAAAKSVAPFAAPLHARVLFMDDEEPIRLMTKALLERLGFDVMLTANGAEAVREYAEARIAGKPFDVVVFDLTVPGGMGGADAMREILKIDPAAKGIVSSGYSSDPVMANHRAHGFRGSVPKPYRIADFSRTIRDVILDE
ncbi:MAG: PAS domain S-box protein [Opitutaceae bacterium]